MLTLLPWHDQQWQQMQLARTNDRLPHALLLEGPDGIGLNHFAQCLARNLLCDQHQASEIACGNCKNCHLLHAESHPDLQNIGPEEEGKQIRVEQIRKLIEFINLTSQYGQYKIVIIDPAENMNRSTANTLLKTLEEPPAQSLIMLISHRPNLLPITIRSRCQRIRFNPTFSDASVHWLRDKLNDSVNVVELLKAAQGAPLAALALSENDTLQQTNEILSDLNSLQKQQCDPVDVAARWNKYNATRVLQLLLQIFNTMTMIKLQVSLQVTPENEAGTSFQQLANRLDLRKMVECHDLALRNYGLASSNISYNTQGLLEEFIIFWQQSDN